MVSTLFFQFLKGITKETNVKHTKTIYFLIYTYEKTDSKVQKSAIPWNPTCWILAAETSCRGRD